MRWIALTALLPFLLACDTGTGTTPDEPLKAEKSEKEKEKKDPVLATTGIGRIQRDHETLRDDVTKWERALEKGEPLDARHVRTLPKRWKILDTAARIALDHYSKQDLEMRRARSLQGRGGMEKEYVALVQEAESIKKMLADAAKGIADLPEGFTEAELRDRLADELEKARALKKKIDERTEGLLKMEAQLVGEEPIPVAKESIFGREVEDLQALKPRIDALVAKLGQ